MTSVLGAACVRDDRQRTYHVQKFLLSMKCRIRVTNGSDGLGPTVGQVDSNEVRTVLEFNIEYSSTPLRDIRNPFSPG